MSCCCVYCLQAATPDNVVTEPKVTSEGSRPFLSVHEEPLLTLLRSTVPTYSNPQELQALLTALHKQLLKDESQRSRSNLVLDRFVGAGSWNALPRWNGSSLKF